MKRSATRSLALCCFLAGGLPLYGQLFDNLRALGAAQVRVDGPAGDPAEGDGPKGLVSGDFDHDTHADWAVSRLDGKIVVAWGRGDGTFVEPVQSLETPASSFRQIIAADLNADGRLDLAAADPFAGKVFVLTNDGERRWAAPVSFDTWLGARNLIAADLTGDGVADLVLGGADRDTGKNFDHPWEPVPLPVPPQPATGVVLYRNDGTGHFTRAAASLSALASVSSPPKDSADSFPRPVYVLESWLGAGPAEARLIVTHALAQTIWIIAADSTVPAGMSITSVVTTGKDGVRALAAGPVTGNKASGALQIIAASRDLGSVIIYRETAPGDWTAGQRLDVPGGPRALRLLDMNGDGWNDLAVASRNTDKLILFINQTGLLANETEAVTGRSPREMAAGDFNEDGRPDLLTLNRSNSSVSTFLGGTFGDAVSRTGFAALDQTYLTGGDIAQLGLHDLNADGRADVFQLHRGSGEASVRLSGPGGRLGEPVFYKMGSVPSAFSLGDINKDGHHDLVCANMGDPAGGFIAVRNGDGLGAFGALETFRPPAEPRPGPADPNGPPPIGFNGFTATLPDGVKQPLEFGQLYAVTQADLDGDGNPDLAAGYYDCRIIFFKGDGQGGFTPTKGFSDHDLYFLTGYEARIITAGDFDQDGDIDLALAAWPGDLVVLENTGNFFLQGDPAGRPYRRYFQPRFNNKFAGARDMFARDANGDGDLDLMIGTGAGVQVLFGGPGLSFATRMAPPLPGSNELPVVPGLDFPITAMVEADLDGDGQKDDLAAICTDDGCLNVFTRNAAGGYIRVVQVEAPLTKWLAAGDIDGDGKTDLAGSGDTLWVALSSRPQTVTAPLTVTARPSLPSLVINEVITNNQSVLLPHPTEATAPGVGIRDCVELFNGTSGAITLTGWILEVEESTGRQDVRLPAVTVAAKKHFSLPFTKANIGTYSSGFSLEKEGCTLRLKSPAGAVTDEVVCPALGEDRSWSRYSDGDVDFHINRYPDPGGPNLDNGVEEPAAALSGIDLATFSHEHAVRFYATALDDVGIVGMSLHWRVRGTAAFTRALLFDDGENQDGGRLDGVFAGVLPAGIPAGSELELYLECEDLSGAKKYVPGRPAEASDEGVADEVYTLKIPDQGTAPAGIEISELMASDNLPDWSGSLTDWMELRNISDGPVDLTGLEIAENFFGGNRRLKINSALTAQYPAISFSLAAGKHQIFLGGSAPTGTSPFYLPFGLSSNRGGQVYLMRRLPSGTQELVQAVPYPALGESGKAWARMGRAGQFYTAPPTPGSLNVSSMEVLGINEDTFFAAIARPAGSPWQLEETSDPAGPWSIAVTGTGDGYEQLLARPRQGPHRFYRLR